MTATAATRPVVGGVDGVIRMDGKACALHIVDGPTALLAADGKPLAIPLDKQATTINPGWNPHWNIPFAEGHGLWGFSWRGSWCGRAPAFVLVPMADDPQVSPSTGPYGDLKVPLSGAMPACHGPSDSVLQPGLPGGVGYGDVVDSPTDALQLPPPTWTGLHATLATATTGLARRLTNTTDTAISLMPCPDYAMSASWPQTRCSQGRRSSNG